jgi:hypothetical protein
MPRRRIDTFNLSFLDVMACGLGAVVLLFMIINHAAEQRSERSNRNFHAEIERLDRQLMQVKNAVQTINDAQRATEAELTAAQDLARQMSASVAQRGPKLAKMRRQLEKTRARLDTLKTDLRSNEDRVKDLQSSRLEAKRQEDATRTFIGKGDRQYLTGLKMGGKHILILVDASASMLDETIVNIIRQRNLPEAQRTRTRKWQRAVATVDWLTTQIPPTSRFQIYTFNVQAEPVIPDTDTKWLAVADGHTLNRAVTTLRKIAPERGTSLYRALAVVMQMKPRPDNIYLLTDGLPTLSNKKATNRTVSAEQRLTLFKQAVELLPSTIPLNIILFPMEGDPRAASAYWQLAQASGGSFLTPAADWP